MTLDPCGREPLWKTAAQDGLEIPPAPTFRFEKWEGRGIRNQVDPDRFVRSTVA